jgi:hypothetical protein
MAVIAPPESRFWGNPGDEDSRSLLRFRLWQQVVGAVTVLVTAWFCTLGAIPAIFALLVAKHVLVSMLVMNNAVDAEHRTETLFQKSSRQRWR